MLKPGHIGSQTVSLKIMSDDQIEDIVQAAFTIVESTGFKILKKGALDDNLQKKIHQLRIEGEKEILKTRG